MTNLISKYHLPDSIYDTWNISSHEQFLNEFLIRGRFHKKVPNEIVKEFETVERLICYSYYHYSLLDEAFSKVTRLFELAVNLRLEELQIELGSGYISLYNKIEKLKEHTSPSIYQEWQNAKGLRNILAHPKSGRLFGVTIAKLFLKMINILNFLFIDKSEVEYNENALIELQEKAEHLKSGLFKLIYSDKAILVWSIYPYSFHNSNNSAKSLWVFHPVYTNFPQTMDKLNFDKPIFLRLKDVEITKQGITAINLVSGKKIKATKTDKEENIKALKNHEKLMQSSEPEVVNMYETLSGVELSKENDIFLYQECWK